MKYFLLDHKCSFVIKTPSSYDNKYFFGMWLIYQQALFLAFGFVLQSPIQKYIIVSVYEFVTQ